MLNELSNVSGLISTNREGDVRAEEAVKAEDGTKVKDDGIKGVGGYFILVMKIRI